MSVLRSYPQFWANFSHERSKKSKLRELLIYQFVSMSVSADWTPRQLVEKIAAASQIPVESLPRALNEPVHNRAYPVFSYAGDEFDKIASWYDNMQWWVSDVGLNMAVVTPASPRPLPTFDDLMIGFKFDRQISRAKKLVRRDPRSKLMDENIRQIAESRPRTHEEVFQALEDRRIVPPFAEPFVSARGWIAGFRRNPALARTWLSKRWTELGLPAFRRGPKSLKNK